MLASEMTPWAKTGGLADVTGALPAALEALGHRVTTIMPRYRGVSVPVVDDRFDLGVRVGDVTHDAVCLVHQASASRRVIFVDIPSLYDRAGLYGEGGQDYADNADRFAVLTAAGLDIAARASASDPVDVIHAHDWQTALAPVLVRHGGRHYDTLGRAGFVLTIHNLAYQGVFDRTIVTRLGLPWSVFTMEVGEFWGGFGFLKAGITSADMLTTVSPTYARETVTRPFGAGLDGVLASRVAHYEGILNGIDTAVWNPSTDPHLPAPFDVDQPEGKLASKRALLARFGLPQGDNALARPLVGMVSRLVSQKGLDLIASAIDELISLDATWVFVGQGDPQYEELLRDVAAAHPTRVGVWIGFDESLAHLVEGGADIFLMPSVFEPCGLNQMYSLRYGAVPVVTAVGGLDDTIQPYTNRAKHANGFKFRDQSPETLVRTLRQAIRLYHDPEAWSALRSRGMRADHSWETSAAEYVRVYGRARHAAAQRATE